MAKIPDPEGKILNALLSVVVADGDADPDELETLAARYAELTGASPSSEALSQRARSLLPANDALPDIPLSASLGASLDDDQRREVLAAALAIAAADGFVLDEEDVQLMRLAHALGLSEEASRKAMSKLPFVRPL